MRIGFDGHVLTGKFQGTRTTVGGLLRALPPHLGRHELILYANEPEAAQALLGTDAFRYLGLAHANSIKRLLKIFPRLFRRDNVELGVFQYMAPLTGRHIVFIHDLLPLTHPRFFPWRMRLRTRIFFTLAIRRAAMVIAVSEFTRREVERLYGLKPDRLRLVCNGPSFSVDAYGGLPAAGGEGTYILAVGRIEPRKNVSLLVEAFQMASLPDHIRLIIVGGHDLGYDYSLPDDPRIMHRTGLDDDQLIALYRGASLFVYPSAAEGFGLPLLDALLFGLPVISSNQTAMAEIGEGFAEMFDPGAKGAVTALAGRISGHFFKRPVSAPSVADRAMLAERFSWDRAAADLVTAIDLIAAAETD